MVHYGYVKQKFKELENCASADVSKHCLAILESYPFLERTEQKEFAETLFKWAENNATRKSLLFCYSKLILAFNFFYREEYDIAFPLLSETQQLFIENEDFDGAAVCKIVQGSIYRTFGDVELALKSLWSGHEQLSKSPMFQHFLMATNINLGGTYFEMKHYDDAIPLFKSTLAIAEPKEKYYWIIYALQGLGKVYQAQKKYQEAKDCLEKAMIASEKYNHPLSICNSLSDVGNYFFTVGELAEAEQFNKRALVLREQNKFIGGAITSCIRLGEIYIKQSKEADAIEILNKGLKLAEQINVKLKMYQIHLLLSEIYERKKDSENSLIHYKIFHDLREEVTVEDNSRKIKNIQLVFEAEQTKKENIIIKKQKEEIEKKNIQLQETIDELTRARIGKKARAITLVIAIVLFILEDFILHFALAIVSSNNYFISLIVKMVIIFSLSPINKAVENYLLSKVIKKEKRQVLV